MSPYGLPESQKQDVDDDKEKQPKKSARPVPGAFGFDKL